jgi:thiol-disulfide isomerase/thioredoxin
MRRIRQAGASPKPGDEDAAPVELTSANWESVVGGGGLAVVSFWAPGCGECSRFGPVFGRVCGRHPSVVFGTVNIQDEPALAARFGIAVPTSVVISGNVVSYARRGALAEQDLEELIRQAREDTMPPGPPPGAAETAVSTVATRRGGPRASYAMTEGDGPLIADQVDRHTLLLTGHRRGGAPTGPGLTFGGRPAAAITPGFLDTSRDFSVSARVRLADTGGWHTVVSQDGIEVSAFYLQYSAADDAWAFATQSADSVKARCARAVAMALPPGGPVAAPGRCPRRGGCPAPLVVDGRLAGAAPFGRGWPAAGPFVIGRGLFGDPADWFTGGIDQVKAFDCALSDAEALALA